MNLDDQARHAAMLEKAIRENPDAYEARYPNDRTSDYGFSIMDDHNGESLEYARLSNEYYNLDEEAKRLGFLLDRNILLNHFIEKRNFESTKVSLKILTPESLKNLVENRSELRRVSPRDFEKLIYELLVLDGFEDIELVNRLNAHGPDIIAQMRTKFGKEKYIIECKQVKDSVGIDVVRNVMYWVDINFRANGAIIATTSGFTRDAIAERHQNHEWRLDLRDNDQVRSWIESHSDRITEKIQSGGEKPDPDWRSIRDILLENVPKPFRISVSEIMCSQCGRAEICGYTDLGYLDTHHHYFHICSKCAKYRYSESIDRYGMPNDVFCPFCRK